MSDDLTEFDFIAPSRVDAVETPASGILFLAMKSRKGKSAMGKKHEKVLKRLQKAVAAAPSIPSIARPAVTGVNIAGPGSTTIGNGVPATRVVAAFLSGLEQRVRKAEREVETAESPMERTRARSDLDTARRQRLLGKLLVKENAGAGHAPSRGSSLLGEPVFKAGSTYTIGEDAGLGYTRGPR